MQFELPINEKAEEMLLARMLLSINAVNIAMIELTETDFGNLRNKAIFSSMKMLYVKDQVIEPLQVILVMEEKFPKELDASFIVSLPMMYATGEQTEVSECIRLIKESSQYRQMIQCCLNTAAKSSKKEDKPEIICSNHNQLIENIFNSAVRQTAKNLEASEDFMDSGKSFTEFIEGQVKNSRKGYYTYRGIPTGFTKLDDTLSGLCRGHFIIIGARPGVGKTTFALNLMYRLAMKGHKIGFFSFEMTRDEAVLKFIALHCGIDAEKIIRGEITDSQYEEVKAAMEYCKRLFVCIDDQAPLTISQVQARTKRMIATHQIEILFIDYLGEIKGDGKFGNKQEEIQQVSRGLRQLAKSSRLPILCICQLNRKSEDEQRAPRKSDLRESGQIEADAHSILMLHQENKQYVINKPTNYKQNEINELEYNSQDKQFDIDNFEKTTTKLYVVKNRFGPQGVIHFGFEGSTGKFFEIDYAGAFNESE
jgi:replicative DNA helicase